MKSDSRRKKMPFSRVYSARLDRFLINQKTSSFVYFPLGDGLWIIPLGGYQSFSVAAWCPLGKTGVIRGEIRNADIVANETV
jgi:hypothetical protein